jgi:hypothetical protein
MEDITCLQHAHANKGSDTVCVFESVVYSNQIVLAEIAVTDESASSCSGRG